MNNLNKDTKANFDAEKERVNNLVEEGKQKAKNAFEQGKEHAENIYAQTKECVNELYEEGRKKIGDAQDSFKDYSRVAAKQVKNKPLSSLLIAGGIGFLLSALFKK